MSHEVLMPRLSQDMEAGQVVEWLKQEGDVVAEGDPLLVVETDKANMEVEAPASGVLRRIVAPVGQDAAVGSVLALIGSEDEELGPVVAVSEAAPSTSEADPSDARLGRPPSASPALPPGGLRQPVSPAARRVAAELGVDLAGVHGSGDGGLVVEADVRAAAASVGPASGSAPDPSGSMERVTEVPLVGTRRRIAERLAASRRTVADVTTVMDVDMTGAAAAHAGSGTPYTALVAWATARALAAFPALNATFADDRLLLHHDINLGVAVAREAGLVVPVIRHADRLSAEQLASAIEALAEAARRDTIAPEQLSGSTFTLTNSGTYGSLLFTPIVNLPEVAILGMGRVADAPVVRDGALAVGKVMYLCLTYDHRAVEGADAVSFLADVKARLEALGSEAPMAATDQP